MSARCFAKDIRCQVFLSLDFDVFAFGVDVEVAVFGAEFAVAVHDFDGFERLGEEDCVGYKAAVAGAFIGCRA